MQYSMPSIINYQYSERSKFFFTFSQLFNRFTHCKHFWHFAVRHLHEHAMAQVKTNVPIRQSCIFGI